MSYHRIHYLSQFNLFSIEEGDSQVLTVKFKDQNQKQGRSYFKNAGK